MEWVVEQRGPRLLVGPRDPQRQRRGWLPLWLSLSCTSLEHVCDWLYGSTEDMRQRGIDTAHTQQLAAMTVTSTLYSEALYCRAALREDMFYLHLFLRALALFSFSFFTEQG